MEKNIQTELDLREEQLQEITGGCSQCTADRNKFAFHQNQAQDLSQLSRTAQQTGLTDIAAQFENLAQNAQRIAEVYNNRVKTRHPGVRPAVR